MNKLFRIGLIIIMLGLYLPAFSQKMEIESFELMENDLDASTYFPKKDFNGKTSAILKIFTTEKDFSFDNGSLGIVEVVYKTAEVWVYVPENTTKLKIAHPRLGHLANAESDGYYWFPRVKSGKSYKIGLLTASVKPPKKDEIPTQWLVVNTTPDGADVYLAEVGGEEKFFGTTPFSKKLPQGDYHLRAKKSKYHDEMALVKLRDERLTMELGLKPAFGAVNITSTPSGAKVFLNGNDTYKVTPCEINEIASGNCDIRVQLDEYAPATRTVKVEECKTTNVDFMLDARFAQVTINSLIGATIKVNGNVVGVSSYTGNLAEGIYDVEASLTSHKSVSKQLEVVAKVPQTIELKPIPKYGELDVSTTPPGATITINGKSYGDTPRTIKDILEGEYEVVLVKEGYANETRRVTISQENAATLDVKMSNGRKVDISTLYPGDTIYVDGAMVGVSRCNVELPFGYHTIEALHNGKKTSKMLNVQPGEGMLSVALKYNGEQERSLYGGTSSTTSGQSSTNEENVVAKKKGKFVNVGVEGDILWGPEETEGANLVTVSAGLAMKLGHMNQLINFSLGARYRFSQDNNVASYNNLKIDEETNNNVWYSSGQAKYKNVIHEIVVPALVYVNLKDLFYIGAGYEHGFLLANKESYEATDGYDFDITEYEGSEEYKVQEKWCFPSRAAVVKVGWCEQNFDLNVYCKIDFASKAKTQVAVGVGVGYFF